MVDADCAWSTRPLPVRMELSQLVSIRLARHHDLSRQSAMGNDGSWNCLELPMWPGVQGWKGGLWGWVVWWDKETRRQRDDACPQQQRLKPQTWFHAYAHTAGKSEDLFGGTECMPWLLWYFSTVKNLSFPCLSNLVVFQSFCLRFSKKNI